MYIQYKLLCICPRTQLLLWQYMFRSTAHITIRSGMGRYANPLMSQNSTGHGCRTYDTRAQSNTRNECAWHISKCDALPHFHVKKNVTASQKQHRTVHPSPVCTDCSDRRALMYPVRNSIVSTVVTVCNFCC
jgi:hypothetical protein